MRPARVDCFGVANSERDPKLRGTVRQMKTARHDACQRVAAPAKSDDAPYGRRIGAQVRLPKLVARHHHRFTGNTIRFVEDTSELRRDTQYLEEIATDQCPVDLFRGA